MGNYIIDIYVHEGGAEGEYSANYPESAPKQSKQSTGGGDDKTNWQKFQGAYKQVAKAWASISLVRNMFAFELSRVGVETGNDVVQNRINFAMDTAGQIGTVTGAFVLGGPVAGVMALAGVGINYAQKAKALDYEKEKESVALNQIRFRAGPSLNRSRRVE